MSDQPTACARLAAAQLDAYNRADLEGFVACYSEDVVILDEAGAVTMTGRHEMRARYARLFAAFRDVRAEIITRVVLGSHCVDHERWSRVNVESGERSDGEILVRYTEHGGLISIVEFLR